MEGNFHFSMAESVNHLYVSCIYIYKQTVNVFEVQ